MRKLFSLFVAVGIVLFMAQSKSSPIKTGDTPVNTWTSAHGVIFDGGLAVGATSGTGADTLSANECEGRMVVHGYDNEQSPVIATVDDTSGLFTTPTRLIGIHMEWVALNSSNAEVSFNSTPLVYAAWWRQYAGGDAGMPWFYQGSFSITGSGGPTSRALMRVSNTGAFVFGPGFWCFVPLVTGSGVNTVYQRINKVIAPIDQPR